MNAGNIVSCSDTKRQGFEKEINGTPEKDE